MHELSIAEALLKQARGAARRSAGGRRVTELHVEIGELSGVVPEVLEDVFPLAAEGTELAGAVLRVKRIAARFECDACGKGFKPGESVGCPACGSGDVDMTRGRELRLTSIEVEDPEEKDE